MATKTAEPVARETDDAPTRGPRKRGRLLLILAVVVALGLGAAAYLVLGAGKAEAGPAQPEAGAVLRLDPINVNLAEGHYLKLGLALQLTKDAEETPDGARALDLAIDTFSNRAMSELGSNEARTSIKAELLERIQTAYDDTVMDVYLTEFVMQ